MYRIRIIFPALFFTLLLLATADAQESILLPARIDSVEIRGNERTKVDVILREIPYQFPDTLDEQDLAVIRNRIQNLYLFNRVETYLSRQGNRTTLLIVVTESWYFFPLPILFINERDWNKISYGLQVSHFNFRGRNEKLSIGGWLGYTPSYFLNYYNPWLGKHERIILGFSLFHRKRPNKIFEFDENITGFQIKIGRQFTLKFNSFFTFDFKRYTLPEPYQKFSASQRGTDYVPTFQITFTYDGRDLFEYPRRGYYHQTFLQRTGLTRREPEFWRLQTDNRLYIPLYGKTSLGVRSFLVFNRRSLPIYDRVFLGYNERIRGYFNRVLPAAEEYQKYDSPNISLSSLELRFPLLPVHYFSWENAPIFSSVYQNLKFGISAGIFIDSGIVWQRNNEFSLPNFFSGAGAGLHFHLPYVYVLRLDYAWGDNGEGQLIFETGVSF